MDGVKLYAEEKRDGTCLMINVDGIYTRNQVASPAFVKNFTNCDHYDDIMWASHCNPEWTFIVELLPKGISPTRMETHEDDDFELFDIWDNVNEEWVGRREKEALCIYYNIPIVRLYGEILYEKDRFVDYNDLMMDKAKKNEKEGIVYKNMPEHIYFKAKSEVPRETIKRKKCKDNRTPLLESDIMGAIAKVEAELGDKFTNVSVAMPLVAKYIRDEAIGHNCSVNRNMFQAYNDYLNRNKEEEQ